MKIRNTIAAVAAALAFAAPAHALAPSPRTMSPMQAIDVLENVVNAAGTDVQVLQCDRPVYGFYQYIPPTNGRPAVDRVVLCQGNGAIDWSNPLSVLETLQHEATHVAQYCKNGLLFDERYHPVMVNTLPRVDAQVLGQYDPEDIPLEIEAFYMENQPAEVVIDAVLENCEKYIQHNAG